MWTMAAVNRVAGSNGTATDGAVVRGNPEILSGMERLDRQRRFLLQGFNYGVIGATEYEAALGVLSLRGLALCEAAAQDMR